MTNRETTFRETSFREKTIRESNHPGNDCKPSYLTLSQSNGQNGYRMAAILSIQDGGQIVFDENWNIGIQ